MLEQEPRRYLIAAGTVGYRSHPRLAAVHRDVQTIASFFTAEGYQPQLLELRTDPTSLQLRTRLAHWLTDPGQRRDDDVAVFYYSGHGDTSGTRHFLLTADSGETSELTAVPTDFLVAALSDHPRTRRLLLILDTCRSGQGALNLAEAAARLAPVQQLDGESEGVWVIAASRPAEEAEDGAFADAFVQAIAREQAHASPIHRYLSLDSITEQVNLILAQRDLRQRAAYTPASLSKLIPPCLVNHNYRPNLPAGVDLDTRAALAREIDTHWAPKARGLTANTSAGWYFAGRTAALRELVAWIREPDADARVRVVTSDPGSGKSALLGRLVLLSDPDTRRLVPLADAPTELAPPEGSIAVALFARSKTVAELLAELAEQSGTALEGDPLAELAAREPPALVVIDALDEATNPRRVIEDLVAALHRPASPGGGPRLIVATRRPWVGVLPADRVELDLDDPAYLGPTDVSDYVTSLLLASSDPDAASPYRAHPDAARQVADAVAAIAGHSFLIAQVAARTLAAAPAMLTAAQVFAERDNWADIGQAFDTDLARYGERTGQVRDLLAPLAWANGSGLPRELWAGLATAVTGREYTDDDVTWVLRVAGGYITEALDEGRPVYRLYHREFVDHIRRERDPGLTNRVIADALLARVPVDAETARRSWLAAHPYIRTHLATHAAVGGRVDDLVTDPGFLIASTPEGLLPALRRVTAPDAQLAAAAYEAIIGFLDTRDPGRAAAQLQLAARQHGASVLADACADLPYARPWDSPWAHWPPGDRNAVLTQHDDYVVSLALGVVDGRPVVVSAGWDGTARMCDLGSGTLVHVFTGHDGEVNAAVLGSALGRQVVVTGGRDATARVWDADTGELVHTLSGHDGPVHAVALGRAGGRAVVVSASEDGTARVWDAGTGELVHTLSGHDGPVYALALDPDGLEPVAVTGGTDGVVRVWDLVTGRLLHAMHGHTDWVRRLALHRVDGALVAISAGDDGVRVWDPLDGTVRFELELVSAHPVTSLVVGAVSGRPVSLVATRWGEVVIHDLASGELIDMLSEVEGLITVALGSIEGRAVAVTAHSTWDTNPIAIWALDLGDWNSTLTRVLTGLLQPVDELVLGDVGGVSTLVTGGRDGSVRAWLLDSGPAPVVPEIRLTASALAMMAAGPLAVTATNDGWVSVWDAETGERLHRYRQHGTQVQAVAIGRTARSPFVVTCDDQGVVRVRDLVIGRTRHRFDVLDPRRIAIGGPTRKPLIACAKSGGLTIRTLASGAMVHWLAGENDDIRDAALTSSFALACDADTLLAWDLRTGRRAYAVRAHDAPIRRIAVGDMAGRPVVATACEDGSVGVLDLTTGEPIVALQGHDGPVTALALGELAGHTLAVTAGEDAAVHAWDLTDGQHLHAFSGHTDPVSSLVLTRAAGHLAAVSAGPDQTARVWDLESLRPGAVIQLGAPVTSLAQAGDVTLVSTTHGAVAIRFAPG